MYKIFVLAFFISFMITQYYVVYEPELLLLPAKISETKNRPPWVIHRQPIRTAPPKVNKAEKPATKTNEKKEPTKAVVSTDKVEVPGIKPLPLQTQKGEVLATFDLDEYLRNPTTRLSTIIMLLSALTLELAVIGYVFGYPIYLDRIQMSCLHKCEDKTTTAAESVKRTKRVRKTRRSKKC